jgi:hypothetical protein
VEVVVAHTERPLRPAELGGAPAYRLLALAARTVEVPPVAAVGDEVQLALWRPFGLEHRFAEAAGNPTLRADVAIHVQLADPHLAAVPRHVRMVPGLPCQPRSVRAELGRGVEVVAAGHGDGISLAVHVEGHDGVDRLASASAVVLAHGEDAAAAGVDEHVGVA